MFQIFFHPIIISSRNSLNEGSLSDKHAWKSAILQWKLDVIKFCEESQTGAMWCAVPQSRKYGGCFWNIKDKCYQIKKKAAKIYSDGCNKCMCFQVPTIPLFYCCWLIRENQFWITHFHLFVGFCHFFSLVISSPHGQFCLLPPVTSSKPASLLSPALGSLAALGGLPV